MNIMGKIELVPSKNITTDDILNKDLVISMLKYEESLTKSDVGKSLYSNPLNLPLVTSNIEKTLNRLTLSQFGFSTSDESVEIYRTIFKTYFAGPTDYDKDVINSSHYMRENKCVFYEQPILKIGDIIPNVELYKIDGKDKVMLYDILHTNRAKRTVIAGFSLS